MCGDNNNIFVDAKLRNENYNANINTKLQWFSINRFFET